MQKPSHRLSRVETQLMREVATILEREIDDPRIKGVTISHVDMSKDLHHAKIYFTLLEESQAEKIGFALNHTVSYLRRRIGESLALRVVPELFFIYDEELHKAQHLTDLINNLNQDEKK
jgi:ribosome-binding factor A